MTGYGDVVRGAVLEDPGDDAVRLVYADWLEESGQQAAAWFVRTQIQVARRHLDLTPQRQQTLAELDDRLTVMIEAGDLDN